MGFTSRRNILVKKMSDDFAEFLGGPGLRPYW